MVSFEAIAIAMSPLVFILSEGIPNGNFFYFELLLLRQTLHSQSKFFLEKQHVSIRKKQRPT